jgi:hypothetical protein
MIKQQKLEDLIREKVLLGSPDSRGFYSHKCQVCNDYKVRAGFKFENGQIGFNCWNCGTTGMYEEFEGKISRKMRNILHSYGIDDSEITQVVNSTFFFKKEETGTLSLKALKKVNTSTPPVKLPSNCFRLGETAEHLDLQQKIVNYLEKRKVDLGKQPVYFSTDERFRDRAIIPFYRNGSLIYWQARSIDPFEKKRYDNPVVSREAVIFNMDELGSFNPKPLFVSEGVFDAMMFNGIAVLGSKLTEAKIELLANSRRRLVFVIDKDENGKSFAEAVLKAGWEITFVPEGADDLNKSVQRFGRAWTAQQLIKNIPTSADIARLALNRYCK